MEELRNFYKHELGRLHTMAHNENASLINLARKHKKEMLDMFGKVDATTAGLRNVMKNIDTTLTFLRRAEMNTEHGYVETLLEVMRRDMSLSHESMLIDRDRGNLAFAGFYQQVLKTQEAYFIRVWRLRYRA